MTDVTVSHMNRPEPYDSGSAAHKLNWLRAGVLGANDGIVSVAATVVGVAGATTGNTAVMIAGTAAKLFTVAGPVLVYGISASVVYGLILWLAGQF